MNNEVFVNPNVKSTLEYYKKKAGSKKEACTFLFEDLNTDLSEKIFTQEQNDSLKKYFDVLQEIFSHEELLDFKYHAQQFTQHNTPTHFQPLINDFIDIPHNDLKAFERYLKNQYDLELKRDNPAHKELLLILSQLKKMFFLCAHESSLTNDIVSFYKNSKEKQAHLGQIIRLEELRQVLEHVIMCESEYNDAQKKLSSSFLKYKRNLLTNPTKFKDTLEITATTQELETGANSINSLLKKHD